MGSFWSSQRPVIPPSSIDSLSDDEVRTLIHAAIERKDGVGIIDPALCGSIPPSAYRITPDTVGKRCRPHEAYIMKYVSSLSTSIHIPKVRRVLPMVGDDLIGSSYAMWLVMDFIDGDTLETAWPKMSWWNRLWTVWQMRRSVRELHTIPIPNPNVPGPFDGTGNALACSGFYFTEFGAGPFESYSAMAEWFDHRRYTMLVDLHMANGQFAPHFYPTFDASHPLVLCHMDLHMRNIIVDRRGDVWLIDWGMAGAFPAWFEYANLFLFARALNKAIRLPKSWTFFAPFIAGNYRWYEANYLYSLSYILDRPNLDHTKGYFEKLGLDISYRGLHWIPGITGACIPIL